MSSHIMIFRRGCRIRRMLMLACLLMVVHNSVITLRQSYDIYHKSTVLRRHRLTNEDNNTVWRSPAGINLSVEGSPISGNKIDKNRDDENLTQRFKHISIEKGTIKSAPVQELDLVEFASVRQTETHKPGITMHKNASVHIKTKLDFVPVLIVAYLKGGSSWLGDMIQLANKIFYVFEPFRAYQQESYYDIGSLCFNNNSCSASNISTNRHGFALFTLEQLFNCRFERVSTKIVSQMMTGTSKAFTKCRKDMENSTKCLNYLKRNCFESRQRVIKTVHISMSIVAKLIELVPNLKLIHLLRDPRAITYSRQKGNLSMSFDLVPHSQNLCKRMEDDLEIAKSLKKKYLDKIVTIIYEALTEYPATGIRFLYNFLHIPLSEMFNTQLLPDDSLNKEYQTIYKSDNILIATWWRSIMTYHSARIIDNQCGRLYQSVGYVDIESETNLKDITYLTRNTNPSDNESWFQ